MATSGPGCIGPGPDASAQLERARRRLYAPGGAAPAVVREYERLAEADRPVRVPADAPGRPRGPTPPRRRRLVLLGALAVAVVGVLIVALGTAQPARPRQVAAPSAVGTTLVVWGRTADPATGPGSITYQPEGYTVHQPGGRVVAVALRCVGAGTVRVSAGARFDFRCTDRERTAVLRGTRPASNPFVVVAATTGDVVWSARVVLQGP